MKRPICPVCDDLQSIALRTGAQTDLFPCPACVGLYRDELDAWALDDAERACREAGVEPRWLVRLAP